MMNFGLLSFPPSPICRKEVLRYAAGGTDKPLPLLEECISEAEGCFSFRVCFRICKVNQAEDGVFLDQTHFPSLQLKKNLEGCSEAVLFASTVGLGIDRFIRKYTLVSPAKALLFQALGAERIESACDLFEEWLATQQGESVFLHPRFSPGYGDLPLSLQKEIFVLLDCEKKLGMTLNQHLLISPTKSVTAVIGLERRSIQ